MKKVGFALVAAAVVISVSQAPVTVWAAETKAVTDKKQPKGPSLHLQCDGNPNNMSAGESIARIIGALTLLSIFAPTPEVPDDSKRKFGAAGVTACSELLDSDGAEGSVARRLPLMLARAIHHIEAKNYEAAIADVDRARGEAQAAGWAGDPYFDRSVGSSFDHIEAAAWARLGNYERARKTSLKKVKLYPHSYSVLSSATDFYPLMRDVTEDQLDWVDRRARITISDLWVKSSRTQLSGRFDRAAEINESFLNYDSSLGNEYPTTEPIASTAVTYALAGNWPKAEALAKRGRDNLETRRLNGAIESNLSGITEIFDLYDIIKLVRDGERRAARQKFAARSQWLSITFPQQLAVNKMLREGAAAEELTGSLKSTPEEVWTTSQQEWLASMLAKDKDNKTLFKLIKPYANAEAFEALSATVWKTKNSNILNKEPFKNTKIHSLWLTTGAPGTHVDGLLLHCALLAKARGSKGFRFELSNKYANQGWVQFGDPGDIGVPTDFFLDADAVIAELRQIIPSPDELKVRRASRKKAET